MPKAIAIDEDRIRKPRRRGTDKPPRPLPIRLLMCNPRDLIAAAVACTAVIAILVNALWLQAGRHPSPMFEMTLAAQPPRISPVATEAVNPLPRPRPPQAEARPAEPVKSDDAMGTLVRTTSLASATTPATRSDGALNASQRVAAVQRALTDYGYGQLKATGTIGADTQAAIQRFERERKLPITGQVSERLVRELGLATGRPIP